MSSQPRYLTKSRYLTGLECPTKLFYTGKKNQYADQKFDDMFLQHLANGGFQIGELAKLYYPGGEPVDTLDYDGAIQQTNKLLERDSVIIYEAAFSHGNLLCRADIVVKNGNNVELIEVKAKSWDQASSRLVGVQGGLLSDFKSKVADLAFQLHIVRNERPEWEVTPYFFFADKASRCPTDGLHQKFRIVNHGGRRRCVVEGEVTPEDLDPKIMCIVPAEEACKLFATQMDPFDGVRTFEDHIAFLADHYERDIKIKPRFIPACGKCEFHTGSDDDPELESGRRECWSESLGWSGDDCDVPNVLNIWNFRKKDKMIADGKILFDHLSEDDIGIKTDDEHGITVSERQWKQVQMVRDGETAHWIDREGLRAEMKKWNFPLHFIDFETSMTAIPFQRGRRPYEGVAFQFSHHIVGEDGSVDHRTEFLESAPGVFPNYNFARALRAALCEDDGTIFRYAPHENTYLNMVWTQLKADASVEDRDELCAFIQCITSSTGKQTEDWCGPRDMVDMWGLVKRYYFHPACPGGSTSIKHILPAVLSGSEFLKTKYSQPYFSRNFPEGIVWAAAKDPYKLLPPLFSDASPKDLDLLLSEQEEGAGIREGGAAMAAYLLLQFEEMSDYERAEIERSLKRYCELDTLAMVMIYEAWKAEV